MRAASAMRPWAALAVLSLVACRAASTADAGGLDAGEEAPVDAGEVVDAGRARFDAGPEPFRFVDAGAGTWCADLALGQCLRDVRCLRIGDAGVHDCLARRAAGCEQFAVDRGVAEGRLRFEPEAAVACLNDYGAGSCEKTPATCAGALVGQVPPDGGCVLDQECTADGFCDPYDNRCPHRCQAWVPAGKPCDTFRTLCNPVGFACAPGDGGIDVCLPSKQPGDACSDFYECGETMYCISSRCVRREAKGGEACGVSTYPFCEVEHFCRNTGDGGVCQRLSGVGGACSQNGGCLPSLRCSTIVTTGVCLPRARQGAPCIAYNDCEEGLFCSPATLACEALPAADGGDCSSRGSFYRCQPNAYCDFSHGDTCALKVATGADCTSSSQCLSNDCVYGTLPDAGYGGRCTASCAERADGGF
ncbi:MAG: hypothetical protein JNG84_03030 [Archangium sp.]|nr:hypothetical protein [Archangium sp.]